ncbi:hypothetical protein HMPREF9193_00637 [Treponema lecithinolyticum ATCC 700332]|uniref:Uncharacterized protein n=1 Tax=Treponema lecithinolyticum ATCC 700332 TaxID=1321815 RepID=A0ABN0P0K1_TRELE|nr:hypothetical protein HMPREF9193_00637 [Treponema lecithinolyticum ATCC 700332]
MAVDEVPTAKLTFSPWMAVFRFCRVFSFPLPKQTVFCKMCKL